MAGTEDTIKSLIGTIFAVIVLIVLVSVGLTIYNAFFGQSNPSPGTMSTFDTIASLATFAANKDLNIPPCILPIEISSGLGIVALSKNGQKLEIQRSGTDHLLNRPESCSKESTCLLLCDITEYSNDIVNKEDCQPKAIKRREEFNHVGRIIMTDSDGIHELVITSLAGRAGRMQAKLEVKGINPDRSIYFTELKNNENLPTCFEVITQLEQQTKPKILESKDSGNTA